MNQTIENKNVTDYIQVYNKINDIVTKLTQIRKEAKFSQEFVSSWLKVSRKKLNEFENGNFDFDLMVRYCEIFSVEIKIDFIVW